MTLLKCSHCIGEERAAEDTDHVQKLLPAGYSHLLCRHERLEMCGDGENFRAALKLQLTTEEQVQKWLEDFQKTSALTWRKSRTYPDSGRYNKYRVDLRCQHKTYSSSSKTSKNTNCPATMFLILKRHMYERKSRSGDPHIEEGYFLHVNLRNEHNHRLNSAEVMRWRDVSNDTIEKLHQLYRTGHSPSSALKSIKYSLQEEEGENYIYAIADRSICPDLQFCYRLYYKLFQKSEPAEKDISEELFKPLELEQTWETTTVPDGVSACIEDGVSVAALPVITAGVHFTEDNEPGPTFHFLSANWLETNILRNTFCCVHQKKETPTGLEQLEGTAEEIVGSLDGQLEEIFGMLKGS